MKTVSNCSIKDVISFLRSFKIVAGEASFDYWKNNKYIWELKCLTLRFTSNFIHLQFKIAWYIVTNIKCKRPKEFQRGNQVSFWTCVNAMGQRPYWPSRTEVNYCTFGFKVIIRRDLRILLLLHNNLWCMHDLSPRGKGNSHLTKLLGKLNYYKESGGTITHLHTWRQDGRHNRFPLWTSLKRPDLYLSLDGKIFNIERFTVFMIQHCRTCF